MVEIGWMDALTLWMAWPRGSMLLAVDDIPPTRRWGTLIEDPGIHHNPTLRPAR